MRVDATFIAVEVDDAYAADPVLAAKLAEVCPVDIYAIDDARPHGVTIIQDNLDECVLCALCLNAAPEGAVRIVKLYDEGAPLQRV